MRGRSGRVKGIAGALAAACILLSPACAYVSHAEPGGAQQPRLMGVVPSQEGEVSGRDLVVALSFDRPMDLDSLERAMSFDPPAPFAVSGESECLVVPLTLLRPDTVYIFRLLPGSAEDLEGGVLREGVEMHFRTRADGVTIEVPSMTYNGEVIEGNDPQGVANVIGMGVGHYPAAGRPGRGNYVIMAHASGRIWFPFNRLLELGEGDEIRLTYGGRVYVYAWGEGRVVHESEMWVVDPTPHPMLTAFVCCAEGGELSPTFQPSYRYVIRAPLKGVE